MQGFLGNIESFYLRMSVGASVRAKLYKAIASMLLNGKKLKDVLDTQFEIYSDDGKKPKEPIAIMLYEAKMRVEDGQHLGRALRDWVSPEEQALFEAGAAAGRIEESLMNAAQLAVFKGKIKRKLWTSVPYPVLLILSVAQILMIVANKVVPAFAKMSPPDRWVGSGRVLYDLAYFVQHFGFALLLLTIGLVIFTIWSMPRTLVGEWRFRLDKLFPWNLNRRLSGAMFLLSVAVLVQSGVKLKEALRVIERRSSPYVAERIGAIAYCVEGGKNLGSAMKASGYEWPDKTVIKMVTSYEKLDGFDKALRQFAEEEIEAIDETIGMMIGAMVAGVVIFNTLIGILISLGSFSIQDTLPGV